MAPTLAPARARSKAPPLFLPSDLSDAAERARWVAAVAPRWRRVWGKNRRDDEAIRAAWVERAAEQPFGSFLSDHLSTAAWLAWAQRFDVQDWRHARRVRKAIVPWRDLATDERIQWLFTRTIRLAREDAGRDARAATLSDDALPTAPCDEPDDPASAVAWDADELAAFVAWLSADLALRGGKRADRYVRLATLLLAVRRVPGLWAYGHGGVDARFGWPPHTTRDLLRRLPALRREFAVARGRSPTSS